MDIDFKALKKIVDDTIMTEGKCIKLICSILVQENEALHSPTIAKIVSILDAWEKTPPVEILKQLEGLASPKS